MVIPDIFDKDRIVWERRLHLFNRNGQCAPGLAKISNLAGQLALDILHLLLESLDAFTNFLGGSPRSSVRTTALVFAS